MFSKIHSPKEEEKKKKDKKLSQERTEVPPYHKIGSCLIWTKTVARPKAPGCCMFLATQDNVKG